MRGKVKHAEKIKGNTRITPAYAGKSSSACAEESELSDHPRLCGEKFGGWLKHARQVGSPPPMRGKGSEYTGTRDDLRITPAYAGKSTPRQSIKHFKRDHPRLCGEKPAKTVQTAFLRGSPPPMRGKGCYGLLRLASCGITPAYAGKRR